MNKSIVFKSYSLPQNKKHLITNKQNNFSDKDIRSNPNVFYLIILKNSIQKLAITNLCHGLSTLKIEWDTHKQNKHWKKWQILDQWTHQWYWKK